MQNKAQTCRLIWPCDHHLNDITAYLLYPGRSRYRYQSLPRVHGQVPLRSGSRGFSLNTQDIRTRAARFKGVIEGRVVAHTDERFTEIAAFHHGPKRFGRLF